MCISFLSYTFAVSVFWKSTFLFCDRAQSWNSPCGWRKGFLTTSGGSFLWSSPRSTRKAGGLCSVQTPTWWTSTKWGPISMGLAPRSCILTVQRMQTFPSLFYRQVMWKCRALYMCQEPAVAASRYNSDLGKYILHAISLLLFQVSLQLDCICQLYTHFNMTCLPCFMFAC